jgi:hypothetical protein
MVLRRRTPIGEIFVVCGDPDAASCSGDDFEGLNPANEGQMRLPVTCSEENTACSSLHTFTPNVHMMATVRFFYTPDHAAAKLSPSLFLKT